MVAATKIALKAAADKKRVRSTRNTPIEAVAAKRAAQPKAAPSNGAATGVHAPMHNGSGAPRRGEAAVAPRAAKANGAAAPAKTPGAARKTARAGTDKGVAVSPKPAAKTAANGTAKAAGKTAAKEATKEAGKAIGKTIAKAAGKTPGDVLDQVGDDLAKRPARKTAAKAGAARGDFTRPPYWDKACADLLKRDRIMKKLIPQFGPVHLMTRGDPFVTLARSVVGQQISVAAAQAVWSRVEAACPKLTPARFVKIGFDKLAACGLSKRKSEYILDLAQHFVSGALHVDTWTSMDDEEVIAELTQIRGIGRWTAEMFLIFNLMRPDVLPLDDVGLIRAISVNYFSGEPVTRSEAREVAANWEPWRTVATWYMWRSLDPETIEY